MAKNGGNKRGGPASGPASMIEATLTPLRFATTDDATVAEPPPELMRMFINWRSLIAWFLRLFIWHRLAFNMQHQQQTNWCWAAVATSVALFFQPASTWTQCAVANGELGRTDCCGSGASGPCNVYGTLNTSLTRVGHLDHMTGSSSTFAQVQTEINGGRPLCVRTAWSGGGAHFLAIIGYQLANNMLAVDDPWYGKSDVAYATFLSSYKGTGSWTHSYFTKA